MLKKLEIILVVIIIMTSCTTTVEDSSVKVPAGNNWQMNVNYEEPDLYLKNGDLTTLSENDITKIKSRLENNKGYALVTSAWLYKNSIISEVKPAGGKYIGKRSSSDIIHDEIVTGCHDEAIVMASLLRVMNLPVIMVDAVSVDWANEFSSGDSSLYVGHVFLEVYIYNRWILLDPSSGEYLKKYDPLMPSFKLKNRRGIKHFYALYKGVDSVDYGVYSYDDLKDNLVMFANNLDHFDTKTYVSELSYLIDYLKDYNDEFYKPYEVDITINYKYTGEYTIDRDHFLWVNVDRFSNGYPITSTKVYKPEGTIHFNNIRSVLPEVYILGAIDIDKSGWSSYGDPEMVYTDELGKKAPVDISNGPVTIDITFDDSKRDGY